MTGGPRAAPAHSGHRSGHTKETRNAVGRSIRLFTYFARSAFVLGARG